MIIKFNQPNSSQYQNFDKLCPEKSSLITNPYCAARLKGKIKKKQQQQQQIFKSSVISYNHTGKSLSETCAGIVSFLPSV